MTLRDKVQELKDNAGAGLRVAEFWQAKIDSVGEDKATAFYKHLGLNHLEVKSFEFDGLILTREPTAAEKLCVKSVHTAQETGKVKVKKVLAGVSTALLAQAVKKIKKLKPADYHSLVLDIPKADVVELTAVLDSIYLAGRTQMAGEIATALGTTAETVTVAETSAAIESLASAVLSGLANDAAFRVASIATRAVTVGLDGKDLLERIARDTGNLSEAPVDRASAGAANRGIGMGRGDEIRAEKPDGLTWQYSALLDANTCGPCDDEDGTEYDTYADAPDVPYAECDGGFLCRCFIVGIGPEE
jgi:hypothetical protein